MNGPAIFAFTLRVAPQIIQRLLAKSGTAPDKVDLFVFHQANGYMLEHLRKKMAIPQQKFCVAMADCGNTVSSTIPIALKHAVADGCIQSGMTIMLVGFGVGYSWGGALVTW
jgi:3-oxoacyl-[acyl-carrier-protein] synthase-3